MTKILDDFINAFHEKSSFSEIKDPAKSSGSLITRIHLTPDSAFEILEVLFGEYKDAHSHYTFIDDKTKWERFFQGPNGAFRVHDYRGLVSIGSQGLDFLGTPSPAYRQDIEQFKSLIEQAAEEYKTVKTKDLNAQLTEAPIANFSRGFLSTGILLERAKKSGSLLELLVLNATLLDATLRLGIILATQLREGNDVVQREMIIQESSSFISERKVYTMAKDEGILSDDEFIEVNELYNFRNTAIHRYFISGLEYTDIGPFIDRYEQALEKVRTQVNALEEKQVEDGVGMTKREDIELSPELVREIRRQERLKIDSKIPVAIVPGRKFMFREEDEDE